MKKYIDAEGVMRACYDSFLKTGNKAYREIFALVEAVPAADTPRWIPVTERLPEEEGRYLVSCDTNYGVEVGRFYIDEDGERYFGCDWNDPDDISAWMPLPEPYKEGEQNV